MLNDLPLRSPEEQGVPSRAIYNTLLFLRQRGVDLHSFLLMRHGFLIFEGYYAPFTRDVLHRMFSVTKSFTSLAIGLLCEEGLLSLDDHIVDYFPEKLPKQGPSEELAQLTIRDMLRMATPYSRTTYKDIHMDDWVKTFFIAKPTHLPGTCFTYDTSSAHTLCALVEKRSGMLLLDYLRAKCLDEIGFSKEAYCYTDPQGVSMGGSGLMATPRDVLRTLALVEAGGVYQGRQLLPRWYLEEATAKQIDTEADCLDGAADHRQGYGYQFWRTRFDGYCMYGMGGQLAVCLPKQDLLFVTTADTQAVRGGDTLILDAVWEHLLPALSDVPLQPDLQSVERLQNLSAELAVENVAGLPHSDAETAVNSRIYRFNKNPLGLCSLSLRLTDTLGEIYLQYEASNLSIPFGLGTNVPGIFPVTTQGSDLVTDEKKGIRCVENERTNPFVASGAWKDAQTLLIRVRLLGARLGSIVLLLSFKGQTITVSAHCHEELGYPGFEGVASGVCTDG